MPASMTALRNSWIENDIHCDINKINVKKEYELHKWSDRKSLYTAEGYKTKWRIETKALHNNNYFFFKKRPVKI